MKARIPASLMPGERAAVEEYIVHIHHLYPDRVLDIVLFGSKARGDDDEESDIDLFLLLDEEDDVIRSELWRIASDVSLAHDVVLSVRVFGQARWNKSRRIRLPLYRTVMADGIPLIPKQIPT